MKDFATMWVLPFLATALLTGGVGLAGRATPGPSSVTQGRHHQYHQSGSQAESISLRQEKIAEGEMISCMKNSQMQTHMMKNMRQDEGMRQDTMKMTTEQTGQHSGTMHMRLGTIMESDACRQMMVNILGQRPKIRQMMKELLKDADQAGAHK